MSNKQQPPMPTLQPGESHMESLIEAAIQGHADTRDAMRWLVRQLVPATQPADVTDERKAFEEWLGITPSGAAHDFGWQAWKARAILALRPVQVPMTDEQIVDCINKAKTSLFDRAGTTSFRIARAVEAHHGITPKASA